MKKLFIFFLAALCCTTAKSWSGNEIDKVDVNLTEQHILGKKPANFFESAANMIGDKKINAADIVLMIKEIK